MLCPDCGGDLRRSAIPGFGMCSDCGKPTMFDQAAKAPADYDGPKLASHVPMPVGDDAVEGGAFDYQVPDFTEPMVGWRAWKLDVSWPESPLLSSVTHKGEWTPRQVEAATCGKQLFCRRGGGLVPGPNCTCGLYSAKTREHLQGMRYHFYDLDRGTLTILGQVNLWGQIVEGSQGWRAQYGYPKELYLPYEAWQFHAGVERMYGVPVKLLNLLKKPS